MYNFEEMLEKMIPDTVPLYMKMESQTRRAISIVMSAESGPNSEFGSIVSDMITGFNNYTNFITYGEQQYHLSIQMYFYLANFCQKNNIWYVADIGCGWNPLQTFYFTNSKINYVGVDYPSTKSALVYMLDDLCEQRLRYVSGEYPDVEIGFPKFANRLGIFLYSMNNLVDVRNYPIVDDKKIDDTILQICYDFDIVAFTVFNGFNEKVFADSPMAETHRIVHITETFEFDDDGPNTDTKLVLLEKKHPDSGNNWSFSEYPEKEYWMDDAEKFKPVGKPVMIEIKEENEFEINE